MEDPTIKSSQAPTSYQPERMQLDQEPPNQKHGAISPPLAYASSLSNDASNSGPSSDSLSQVRSTPPMQSIEELLSLKVPVPHDDLPVSRPIIKPEVPQNVIPRAPPMVPPQVPPRVQQTQPPQVTASQSQSVAVATNELQKRKEAVPTNSKQVLSEHLGELVIPAFVRRQPDGFNPNNPGGFRFGATQPLNQWPGQSSIPTNNIFGSRLALPSLQSSLNINPLGRPPLQGPAALVPTPQRQPISRAPLTNRDVSRHTSPQVALPRNDKSREEQPTLNQLGGNSQLRDDSEKPRDDPVLRPVKQEPDNFDQQPIPHVRVTETWATVPFEGQDKAPQLVIVIPDDDGEDDEMENSDSFVGIMSEANLNSATRLDGQGLDEEVANRDDNSNGHFNGNGSYLVQQIGPQIQLQEPQPQPQPQVGPSGGDFVVQSSHSLPDESSSIIQRDNNRQATGIGPISPQITRAQSIPTPETHVARLPMNAPPPMNAPSNTAAVPFMETLLRDGHWEVLSALMNFSQKEKSHKDKFEQTDHQLKLAQRELEMEKEASKERELRINKLKQKVAGLKTEQQDLLKLQTVKEDVVKQLDGKLESIFKTLVDQGTMSKDGFEKLRVMNESFSTLYNKIESQRQQANSDAGSLQEYIGGILKKSNDSVYQKLEQNNDSIQKFLSEMRDRSAIADEIAKHRELLEKESLVTRKLQTEMGVLERQIDEKTRLLQGYDEKQALESLFKEEFARLGQLDEISAAINELKVPQQKASTTLGDVLESCQVIKSSMDEQLPKFVEKVNCLKIESPVTASHIESLERNIKASQQVICETLSNMNSNLRKEETSTKLREVIESGIGKLSSATRSDNDQLKNWLEESISSVLTIAANKDATIKELQDQKSAVERELREKHAKISSLESNVELMKAQLESRDNQIKLQAEQIQRLLPLESQLAILGEKLNSADERVRNAEKRAEESDRKVLEYASNTLTVQQSKVLLDNLESRNESLKLEKIALEEKISNCDREGQKNYEAAVEFTMKQLRTQYASEIEYNTNRIKALEAEVANANLETQKTEERRRKATEELSAQMEQHSIEKIQLERENAQLQEKLKSFAVPRPGNIGHLQQAFQALPEIRRPHDVNNPFKPPSTVVRKAYFQQPNPFSSQQLPSASRDIDDSPLLKKSQLAASKSSEVSSSKEDPVTPVQLLPNRGEVVDDAMNNRPSSSGSNNSATSKLELLEQAIRADDATAQESQPKAAPSKSSEESASSATNKGSSEADHDSTRTIELDQQDEEGLETVPSRKRSIDWVQVESSSSPFWPPKRPKTVPRVESGQDEVTELAQQRQIKPQSLNNEIEPAIAPRRTTRSSTESNNMPTITEESDDGDEDDGHARPSSSHAKVGGSKARTARSRPAPKAKRQHRRNKSN